MFHHNKKIKNTAIVLHITYMLKSQQCNNCNELNLKNLLDKLKGNTKQQIDFAISTSFLVSSTVVILVAFDILYFNFELAASTFRTMVSLMRDTDRLCFPIRADSANFVCQTRNITSTCWPHKNEWRVCTYCMPLWYKARRGDAPLTPVVYWTVLL